MGRYKLSSFIRPTTTIYRAFMKCCVGNQDRPDYCNFNSQTFHFRKS